MLKSLICLYTHIYISELKLMKFMKHCFSLLKTRNETFTL